MSKKLTTFLLLLVLSISTSQVIAQTTNGIFFQAVARDNFSNPAKDRKIYVQSSIIQSTPTGNKVLTEEHQAYTDATGVFSISLGNGVRVGGTASSLTTIDWSKGPFYLNLKVAITPIGGSTSWDYTKEWVDMGTTSFGAVPFALYSASSAKVDDKLNITDTTKMLAVYAKAMSVKTLETAVASKLTAADTLTMLAPYAKAAYTIDSSFFKTQLATKLSLADSTKYVTPTQLASYNFSSTGTSTSTTSVSMDTTSLSNRINLKANSSDVITSLNLKANASDVTSALSLKANASDLTSGLALKLDANKLGVANGIATLNASGIIPSSQLPPVTLSSTNVVGSDADMIALSSATVGSIAIRTDLNKNYVLSATPASTLSNWVELLTPAAPVQAVNGYVGAVNIAKSDIGLGNVDNTSDATKPISNPTQAALNLKLDANKVGVATGVASLNAFGKIPTDQIPAISFSSVKVLNSQSAMLTLSNAVVGSVVIRTDVNKNYVLAASDPTILSNWVELLTPAPPVQTVNGYSGNVSIAKSDIGLGNVDNTSDANKPISLATQTALDLKANTTDIITSLALKAPLASPAFTGTVTTGAISTGALSATSITAPIYASAPKQLTYTGSTINWNPAQGLNAYITLTQNSSLSFTAAPPVGSYGTVVLTQDNTGSRTLSLPTITNVTNKVLGSTSTTTVTLSTAANSKDILNFYYDGSTCYWNIGQGYGAASITNAVPTNLASAVTGTLAVANGGTGATTLTGLVKGNGTSAFTAAVAGTDYISPNATITGASKTKITYDNKGLVTSGADATTQDITPSTNRNYVTDAQAQVISNTSGVNTGDETTSTIKTKLGITALSGSNTGDQTINLTGDVTGTGTGTFTTTIGNSRVINSMLAGNITSNKLVGTDIATVGTITTGTWSGTTIAVANGGTGATTLTINNVLLGNGTNALQVVAPGASGNVLTSNGTTWTSSAPSGGSGIGGHYVGEVYGGGIVFYVTAGGFHGLILDTYLSDNNPEYMYSNVKNPLNHNTDKSGNLYTDWYVPTYQELTLLYNARSNSTIATLTNNKIFLSSDYMKWTQNSPYRCLNFSTGSVEWINGDWTRVLIPIRSF